MWVERMVHGGRKGVGPGLILGGGGVGDEWRR